MVKFNDIKVGDELVADSGFTCLSNGITVAVQQDDAGFFVTCYNGKHHLDGQLNDDGDLVGFKPKEKDNA